MFPELKLFMHELTCILACTDDQVHAGDKDSPCYVVAHSPVAEHATVSLPVCISGS